MPHGAPQAARFAVGHAPLHVEGRSRRRSGGKTQEKADDREQPRGEFVHIEPGW
jgi:hypothetical protein